MCVCARVSEYLFVSLSRNSVRKALCMGPKNATESPEKISLRMHNLLNMYSIMAFVVYTL